MFDMFKDHRDPPGIMRSWLPPTKDLDRTSRHIRGPRQSLQSTGCRASEVLIHGQSQFDILAHPTPTTTAVVCSLLHIFDLDFLISLFSNMDLPLRAYFFSPLNGKIDQSKYSVRLRLSLSNASLELRDRDKLLNIYNVDAQMTRVADILTTFRVALHSKSRFALLLFAESLRVCFRRSCLLSCSQQLIDQPKSIHIELRHQCEYRAALSSLHNQLQPPPPSSRTPR